MESALEGIQFLANSENRIRVLSALTDGKATRRQLQEELEYRDRQQHEFLTKQKPMDGSTRTGVSTGSPSVGR